MPLPHNLQKLRLVRQGPVLTIWLNEPQTRNALSAEMAHELTECFAALKTLQEIRVVILRGSGGFFCAGGNLKTFAAQSAQQDSGAQDAIALANRRGGALMQAFAALDQATIAVVEGVAMGGGFGFTAIADIALATKDAKFALSEVLVGLIPAQISPFVVRKIGYSAAKILAITGADVTGEQACAIGLVAQAAADGAALDLLVEKTVRQLLKCSPNAIACTKALLDRVFEGAQPLDGLLDEAAKDFSKVLRGPEGAEGTAAFTQKRKPNWAADWSFDQPE